MANYGRNRQSLADIEEQLQSIFNQHPDSHLLENGEIAIPADGLFDILRSFSDAFNGEPLLSDAETEMLEQLLATNSGLEVTPKILLELVAQKTKASPPRSPESDDAQLPNRGREDQRDGSDHHRSSSNESNNAYYRGPSRPPSRGPQTPGSAKSPFDAERRQRSTPLTAAPSSWSKRPTPAHRRKSDAGSRSDSDYGPPSSFNRSTGRSRAPSNPTSPSNTSIDLNSFSPIGSPMFGGHHSRPSSRQHSHPSDYGSKHFPSGHADDHGYSSPDEKNSTVHGKRYKHDSSFRSSIATRPLPRSSSDSDSDEENSVLGLVLDRANASSTASMEPFERLDALQRQNEDLKKKCKEAEDQLAKRLLDFETDYANLQGEMEELRAELSQCKRDEKELRSKERQNTHQITALESEVAKVSKLLEHARATYNSLHRQYQEQCALSEKYRGDLRQRDDRINALKEAASLHEHESTKWVKEHEGYEDRIAQLELELSIGQQTYAQLEEQKQENLLLKETIDRMRFDMDELRNAASTNLGGYSGQSSAANTISKSLGAELAGKMNWGLDDETEVEEEGNSGETVVEIDDEDTEGEEEDVIQTIITRKKRKVASRAVIPQYQQRAFEEVKEYSDTATQHDPTEFALSRSTQTETEPKVLKVSFSIQTEEPPSPALPVQENAESVKITAEMEIQTEDVEEEEEPSRSPSPRHVESLASSSSTVVPPTPRPLSKELDHDPATIPMDQPPAYNQINTHDHGEHDWNVAADVLKKWHHGVKIPFEPVEGGISEEAVEEWKALKEELGVDCVVIDKIVASSEKAITPRLQAKNAKTHRSRFYNIYNTYVYGDKNTSSIAGGVVGQAMMFVGASALVILAISPYMVPHYSIPGGATYYDRSAWNSFNSMQAAGEGFSPDGTAAVWNFLGRVGGGAARIARGWPT